MIGALRRLLNATDRLFGDVFPRRSPPARGHQPVDGRTAALRVLRAYVCSLVFYCPDSKSEDAGPIAGGSKAFQIKPENFLLDTPSGEQGRAYPSIAVVTVGEVAYEAPSFTPTILEETRDKYGAGTALERHHAHVEKFILEVWASTEPELRSIMAGLEAAFNPIEGRAGLLFKMPQFFDVLVRFLLTGRENFSDNDAALNRRHAHLKVSMDFHAVSLVAVVPLVPQVQLTVGTLREFS
jgi:hypothetical protein